MNRKEQNHEILQRLQEFFGKKENEDIRFFQGLTNLGLFKQQVDDRCNVTGIDDPFYQDSSRTLSIINQSMNV